MKPEHWQQIKTLLQAALEREPHERAAFFKEACADDPSLQSEVESLIASHEQAGGFIESPAFAVMAESLANNRAESVAGQTLGHYKVLAQLGAGGMGEVYLAQDTRLGRKIALKLLPAYFTDDRGRLQRFQQEARAASALNHPNIITIHEVGEQTGRHFIATELIEGETLRERVRRTQMKPLEAINIAIEIASALSAAHAAGIIHRDIKPENIMVREDGIVKVLDFGLAKLTEAQAPAVDSEAMVRTTPGMLMGTTRYMSPEQVRGLEVDERTDIWSLGCVLYEMSAGRAPFEGSTTSDIIAAILERTPPPPSEHDKSIPPELELVIRKALHKEREGRYQRVRELLSDLQDLKQRVEFEVALERSSLPKMKTGQGKAGVTAEGSTYTTSISDYPIIKRDLRRKVAAMGVVTAAASLIIALAVIRFFYPVRTAPATVEPTDQVAIESVAVMPFVNAGAQKDMEYLSDGITESIINNLSRLPKLKVMARSSVFRYKGKEIDPQAVGRELNVRAVLLGRLEPRGDDLAISIELVDARDNRQLWGERYNRKLSDMMQVQADISHAVSEKLRLRLTGEEQKLLAKRYTENTEAYQAYLKGRYFWNKRNEEGFGKAIAYFQQAIDIDPNYALAYAGLADSYILKRIYALLQPGETLQQMEAKAKAAAEKALAIDETLAEAHTSLGMIKAKNWERRSGY
jgi:serine/threonine-protein kinase